MLTPLYTDYVTGHYKDKQKSSLTTWDYRYVSCMPNNHFYSLSFTLICHLSCAELNSSMSETHNSPPKTHAMALCTQLVKWLLMAKWMTAKNPYQMPYFKLVMMCVYVCVRILPTQCLRLAVPTDWTAAHISKWQAFHLRHIGSWSLTVSQWSIKLMKNDMYTSKSPS